MPSSVIFGMQYMPAEEELYIGFHGGNGTYRYFDVLGEEWREFLDADSKGTYLNAIFKAREHPYQKVDPPIPPPSPKGPDGQPLEWGDTRSWRKKTSLPPKKGPRRVEPEGGEQATA